ncbi:hypothetical protein Pan5_30 [Pseudanabaena phage Pan5]|nr:hypothetical protein Pan5_30 [Pseudanabaena phage Pan5]
MNNATISISKVATKIVGGKVTIYKLGQFSEAIGNHDVISITGLSKPAKLAKYQELLVQSGYQLADTVWFTNAGFEGSNADVINFSFIYTKSN